MNNLAKKFLCVLGIMSQSAAFLLAGNAEPDSESTDYVNLLKNGGFEAAKNENKNYPADWTYVGGGVPGEWGLMKPGHEGKQCVRLWSDKPEYHGCVYQMIALDGNRRYRFSAWVKADISKGGEVSNVSGE